MAAHIRLAVALVLLSLMGGCMAALVAETAPAAMPEQPLIGDAPPAAPGDVVTVRIDRSKVVLISRMHVGVTETHLSADSGQAVPEAVARGTALLRGVAAFENTHIQGWGVGVIEPSPGVWDWSSMDRRMEFLRRQKTPIVITLCSAPGWMKAGGNDWDMGAAIKPEMNDAFAALCAAVARRYPDVRYYQVWNEFKGYWSAAKNQWDVEAYTALYNKVYDALKAVDGTLHVGGFYLVVAGTGSAAYGFTGQNTALPMMDGQKDLLRYWTVHRHGADFVCVDKGIPDYHDHNAYTDDQLISLTGTYEKATREVAELSGGLPVWWSEFYSYGRPGRTDITGASYASAYIHALKGGATNALVWNPNQGELDCYLYTDVRKADGGMPVEHYAAFKALAQDFQPGVAIVEATTSSRWVEVLASQRGVTLLVNKWHAPVTVALEGKTFQMQAYEIKVLR